MLKSFTVENYRSFTKQATIELRPITLLLGKNSSGKSSLTRLIPLLQQSLDRRTASPILWTSDVVDFGDINNAIAHGKESSTLDIRFEVEANNFYRYAVNRSPYIYSTPSSVGPLSPFEFTARLSSRDGRTRYHSTQISHEGMLLEIFWTERGISYIELNGERVNDYFSFDQVFADTTNLFPTITFRGRAGTANLRIDGVPQIVTFGGVMTYEGLVAALDYFINKKTGQSKRSYIRRNLVYAPPSQIHNYVASLDNIVKGKLKHQHKLDDLSRALFISEFPVILGYIESVLRPLFEGAAYLGPSRASGARFYRYQELSVDRIDSRGENLAMYLSSLNESELDRFNEIFDQACGFTARIKRIPGHASIEIAKTGSSDYENLADVGFGFSQFLPIVAQIHAAGGRTQVALGNRYGRQTGRDFVMAVEQPELHLHPAFQANLADLFVASTRGANDRHNGRRFLIETHSETMIARLSELIAEKVIAPSEAIIYFIEKSKDEKSSSVRVGGFKDSGEIENWPLGFFTGSM